MVPLVVLATAQAVAATASPESVEPWVEGQTIRWSDPGWWQVQDAGDYREICAGNIDEINSCDVGRAGSFIVINHTTGGRWTLEVADADPGRSVGQPTLLSADYEQQGYVSVIWAPLPAGVEGVNLYRDDEYKATVKTGTVWSDFEGRPGSVYYAVAFRGDDFSDKSSLRTATVDRSDWYPERDHSEAEDRIRNRLYGDHLSDATREQIVRIGAIAFGDRPSLIGKWHRDAGGEIHRPAGPNAYVRCGNALRDTRIYLSDRVSEFTIVRELAHVIDCSKSSSLTGTGRTDGIGDGMSGEDRANLVAERTRLSALKTAGLRPTWLRNATFSSRAEFFADVSAYFLASQVNRTAMAIEAPLLYETLRSYYGKSNWAEASDIAWQSDPTLPRG